MTGETISHYKVLDKLGEGGMGVVYRAEDTRLHRIVALKFIRPEAVEDPELKARFLNEAEAAAAMIHPNICVVHEIDQAGDRPFIAMEYVEGESLAEKVKRRPLPLDEALDIATQIADGLHAAHRKGIVHRDIKIANIMIDADGRAKIMDFGLAHLGNAIRITKTGTSLGTPAYMSPEQMRGEETDHRTDIWSLGIALYEMLTGQPPFRGESEQVLSHGIINEEPEPLTAVRSGVPIGLDQLVAKALAKRASERYQHVDEILVDLRALQKAQESGVDRPAKASSARRWGPGVAIAATIALAAVVAVVVFMPGLRESSQPLPPKPLTSFQGEESHPTFSPEGEQVAFCWNGEAKDNYDIYVLRIDGGAPLRLTEDPAMDYSPAWSPDGSSVAFLRRIPGNRANIMLTSPLGGPERKLGESTVPPWHHGSQEGPHLTWTPDAKWLAVMDRNSPQQPRSLYLFSMETHQKRRLTDPPADHWGDCAPAFSWDGRKLAFIRVPTSSTGELHTLDLSEDFHPIGEPKRLAPEAIWGTSPAWSPDGSEILFAAGPDNGASSLQRVAASGSGTPTPVKGVGQATLQPAVSRISRRLTYMRRGSHTANIWSVGMLGPGGEADAPVERISSSRIDAFPHVSPDGNEVAFTSNRSGNYEIWVSNTKGVDSLQLTQLEWVSGHPRWSPDARYIVFDSRVERGGDINRDIYRIRSEGGKPERLTTDPAQDRFPSWSRDGRWIYFDSNRSGGMQVWKLPAEGGQAVQVTQDGGNTARESMDGAWIYYSKAGGLWKTSVDGGEEVPLFGRRGLIGAGFDIAEGGIFFIPRSQSTTGSAILFFDFATSKITPFSRLASDRRPGLGLSVSPDGRSIWYSQIDGISSDLMLVENFR